MLYCNCDRSCEKIIGEIKKFLITRNEAIAVAESATSGLLQLALSTAKDATKFYHGGITTYNLGQKCRHLFVDAIKAENCNCVSQEIANQMALGVGKLFGCQWGVGVVGYATRVKESENKLFAYFAISYQEKILLQKKITVEMSDDDQLPVQAFYVSEILKGLRSCLMLG